MIWKCVKRDTQMKLFQTDERYTSLVFFFAPMLGLSRDYKSL